MIRWVAEIVFHSVVRTLVAFTAWSAWIDEHQGFAVFFALLFGIFCWLTPAALYDSVAPAKKKDSHRVSLRHRPDDHPPRS